MHLKYKKNIGYINVWNEGMNELFFMSQSILTCLLQIKVKGRIVSEETFCKSHFEIIGLKQ